MKPVPYAQPMIGDEERSRVMAVLDSGMIAMGPQTAEFERQFAGYVGTGYAVATNNGTSALHVALLAAGIGPGDKVITTPFTFIASSNSILYCGATPVFADVDPRTFNIDPASVQRILDREDDVKAIMVVHLYGLSCEMDPILEMAESRGLTVIEDCAQAHGARYRDRAVGSFGDVAIFSFYPTKNMTTGEGGMVVTSRKDIADRARKLINHGRCDRYLHDSLGYNYRMTDIAAAIGLCQLAKLDGFNPRRRENAAVLNKLLSDLSSVILPYEPEHCLHVYHQYTIRAKRRDELKAYLDAAGVQTSIVYPMPNTKQPLYMSNGLGQAETPVADVLGTEVISLPIHPGLSAEHLVRISDSLHAFYNS